MGRSRNCPPCPCAAPHCVLLIKAHVNPQCFMANLPCLSYHSVACTPQSSLQPFTPAARVFLSCLTCFYETRLSMKLMSCR